MLFLSHYIPFSCQLPMLKFHPSSSTLLKAFQNSEISWKIFFLIALISPPLNFLGFPGGSVVKKKNPPANTGDSGDKGLISGSGRSSGEGNGKPLQYSCLGNPTDRGNGPWSCKESDTTYQLNSLIKWDTLYLSYQYLFTLKTKSSLVRKSPAGQDPCQIDFWIPGSA